MKEFNIVISGVGGQGVLTLKLLIARAAFFQGFDVKTSEIHGLSQRGGSLISHIRFGDKIYSPMVLQGEANLIFSLEPLEALRTTYYASKEMRTVFVVDTFRLNPVSVMLGEEDYPSLNYIKKNLEKFSSKVYLVDATKRSIEVANTSVTANVFLLGFASANRLLPLKREFILKAMEETIPPKFFELNKKVFEEGETYPISLSK